MQRSETLLKPFDFWSFDLLGGNPKIVNGIQRKARRDQRPSSGALAPGIGSTAIPALDAGLHQLDPGIGDAGRAGVGHQRDRSPRCRRSMQLRHSRASVVLVKARRRRRDGVMR